ncbi:MAG: PAS domain S-box protein [Syntrophomonas sp.]
MDEPVVKEDFKAKQAKEANIARAISSALENASNGFAILNDQWEFEYISPKGQEYLFKPLADFLGKSIWTEFPGLIDTQFYKDFQNAARVRKLARFQYYIKRLNGWYEIIVSPDEFGICVVINNITERKLAELALYESEEKFSRAFHGNPDPVTITSLDNGCYVEVNEAFIEFSGFKREEVIGTSAAELGIWVDLQERDKIIKQLCTQGYTRYPKGVWFCSKFGELHNFLISAELIEINERAHVLWVTKDMSALKRSEEALRQSEERFTKVFHSGPIMMILATLEEGRIVDVNEATCIATGYKREEIIGHTILEKNLAVNYETRQKLVRVLFEKEKLENYKFDVQTKSGEILNVVAWSQLLYLNGEPHYVTGMIDITEQKRVEKEIARLDRLNLVGKMAASISHEIRNPITLIRGFLQLLSEKQKYAEDLSHFQFMIEELDRANDIIGGYLGMARDKEIDLRLQSLDEVVKSLYPMILADVDYQGMHIQLDLGNPPIIVIDAKEIRQVILNMARNALEAMESGGTLTIGSKAEGDEVVLFIKDQGEGLSPELIDKIGTPFITTKDTGTGLGLAVCYSIAVRHEAWIDFETSAEGTTFFMHFPLPGD